MTPYDITIDFKSEVIPAGTVFVHKIGGICCTTADSYWNRSASLTNSVQVKFCRSTKFPTMISRVTVSMVQKKNLSLYKPVLSVNYINV